jgi:anti-sigma factor RsiW
MRKFIFNGAVLGALFGGWSVLQATRKGPRDWRLAFSWISWAMSLTLAIDSVVRDSHEAETEQFERKKLE